MANSFVNLETLEWSNRDPQLFFDAIVGGNSILSRFSVFDGIKSKKEVPIFEAELVYDDSMCTYDPKSSGDIAEKEFIVGFKRWGFQNCKNVLEDTYRSKNLAKGQLNEETLDAQYAAWAFDYFVKKNSENLLDMSWNGYIPDGSHTPAVIAAGTIPGIKSELLADLALGTPTVHEVEFTGATTKTNILERLAAVYQGMGTTNLKAAHGDADVDFKPVFMLGVTDYTFYQLAVAAAETTSYSGVEKGLIKTFLNLEVLLYSPLEAGVILSTPMENLVLSTDDFNDAQALQTEYDKKTNSDNIWGQYKIGFSYKQGDRITYGHVTA